MGANNAAVPAGGGRSKGGSPAWYWILGLLAALLIIWALWAAFRQPAGPQVGVTLQDIQGNPQAYIGQTVTVSGEIQEAIGPNAFVFDRGDIIVVGARELAQITGTSSEDFFSGDPVVQVTGSVTTFIAAEMERQLGYPLDAMLNQYEGRPAIIAQEVLLLEPGTLEPAS